jgi:hypothetical protein
MGRGEGDNTETRCTWQPPSYQGEEARILTLQETPFPAVPFALKPEQKDDVVWQNAQSLVIL